MVKWHKAYFIHKNTLREGVTKIGLDFVKIAKKDKGTTIFPDFRVSRNNKDLMTRGRDFYAVYDEETKLWSTNEHDVQRLVDKMLYEYNEEHDNEYKVSSLGSYASGEWDNWTRYVHRIPDNYIALDEKVIFDNTEVVKEDYASRKLNYSLLEADIPAYEKLISTLYDPVEREKFEWAIGSIISGDSKDIQKFFVFYGPPGSGKSTVLNIVSLLFKGYWKPFNSKELGSNTASFALEDFKTNPLVSIDHDADLSHIETNTRLNSIVSHESVVMNGKYEKKYDTVIKSLLFIGTNSPVKITDAKSGLTRRLIDIVPSERKLPTKEYDKLMRQIKFELGGIAYHCLKVYEERGKNYYGNYVPIDMISATNDFYNFVVDQLDVLNVDEITCKTAWAAYKEYCDYARVPYPYPLKKFKEELKSYYNEYYDRKRLNNDIYGRNVYVGFKIEKIDVENIPEKIVVEEKKFDTWLDFKEVSNSIFDLTCSDLAAQYSTDKGTPKSKWKNVQTKLSDIDTSKEHYVKVPFNHIIIDFDKKNKNGEKDLALNIKAASKWPETYAELSKSGNGIHLHYIYDGDPSLLCRLYEPEVEIKVYSGDSSLRRRLSKCVNKQIAHINSGLPLKGEKVVISKNIIKDEKKLRFYILKNLNKEIHPNTKPSMDFIYKLLEDAYASGFTYDVTDMRPSIQLFAINSTNQSDACMKMINTMKFKSEEPSEYVDSEVKKIAFYDVEVFPNLFVLCYKIQGEDKTHRLINPKAYEVEEILKYRLIGFNNRNYDNHIIYAAILGYSVEQLYTLSQRIIANSPNSKFGEAYNLSYTDIYDFASAVNKQGLKKWQIELGIAHIENAHPWDQPVEEAYWDEIATYCCNDVESTEIVFNHLSGDYKARCALAKLAGGSPNDTTNQLSLKFVFQGNKKPELVYTDLATGKQSEEAIGLEKPNVINAFPGYEHIPGPENKGKGRNMYRGIDLGFGGFVDAVPGMYGRTMTFDVAGQHPASIIAMNLFGKYTKRFADIVAARLAIKHKDFEKASQMFDGALAEFLVDKTEAKALANALKTVVNSMYGLTSAGFDNPARDPRNVNNIVALRGALFMKTLEDEVRDMGYTVIHVKTDSIKIVNPDEKIYDFVVEFGKKYGYEFEVEHSFEKICLVNNAVYIAKLAEDDPEDPGKWTATGTQFAVPYVFKKLFSNEEINFADMCETKSVKSAMYLDMNEHLSEDEHNYIFVGRVGSFCPIKEGAGGGILLRDAENGKYSAVTGTKGYRWLESAVVQSTNKQSDIDLSYFEKLIDDAIKTISEFGDFYEFSETIPF